MAWVPELITDGEIDALRLVAAQAWADDTQYPKWQKGSSFGGGQCYVTSVWLQRRLGGFVGKKAGHFVWLSPDKSTTLDLTGNHSGKTEYKDNDGYSEYPIIENKRVSRFVKRANLLLDNLPKVIKVAADSLVGDAFPGEQPQRQNDIDDQYWHDEPDVHLEDEEYNFFYANQELEIAPAKDFDHDELKSHLHLEDSDSGPMAAGVVVVKSDVATWQVKSNINLRSLVKVFKDYSKAVGWDWGGMTDITGEPINDDFAPDKKSKILNYVWSDDHLYIGRTSHSFLALNADAERPLIGTIEIVGSKARISPVYLDAMESLFEWGEDQGFELYGSSNNLVERNETMEQKDLGNMKGEQSNPVEGDGEDDSPMPAAKAEAGIISCPTCDALFVNNRDFQTHRRKEHGQVDEIHEREDGKFPPAPDMDDTNPAHFTPQQPDASFPVYGSVMIVDSYKKAARVDGFKTYAKAFQWENDDENRFYVSYRNGSPVGYAVVDKMGQLKMIRSAVTRQGIFREIMDKVEKHYPYLYTHMMHDWEGPVFKKRGWVNVKGQKWVKSSAKEPKDLIEAAIPFVYDIAGDTLSVGRPGEKTSDIPGQFTPGGIVEGEYDKGGKVTIFTMTNMPYSVNHLLALWYHTYPELLIKSVFLEDEDGGKTKLANAGT